MNALPEFSNRWGARFALVVAFVAAAMTGRTPDFGANLRY
jgi:hypothetical protein